MAADNDLEKYSTSDLDEISSYGKRSSVIIALDAEKDSLLAMSDEGLKILRRADINSGSGRELRDFINEFSIDDSKKFLIIWDHGSSWIGDSKYENDFSVRSVALDEDSEDALTIPELSKVLEGKKFELLGFDACFMGAVEVVYQLRRSADYIIASGDYEPGDGWYYSFLENLKGSPIDIAKSIVNTFSEEYSGSIQKWSLSVFGTSKIDDLVSKFRDFTSGVSTSDVRNLADNLENSDTYKKYLKSVRAVLKIYEDPDAILNDVVVYGWSNGGYLMNVFFPNPGRLREVRDDYTGLEFATDTGWLEYLEEAGL